MARKLDVSPEKILAYEKDSKSLARYEAAYIDALEEYVSLASREQMTFRAALKIYMNQRSLHKYNINYKLALFGKIMYESVYANMDAMQKEDAVTELPQLEEEVHYRVWSDNRYRIAFSLLSFLRKMLEMPEEDVSIPLCFSKEAFKKLEAGTKNYRTIPDVKCLVMDYAEILNVELRKRGITKDVYSVIANIIENGYTQITDDLKLKQVLLNELYK